MPWFRENLRTLNFVASDTKLSDWTSELVLAMANWESHITARASNKSSREKEFVKKLRLFNELEASLLSINQLLKLAQLELQLEQLEQSTSSNSSNQNTDNNTNSNSRQFLVQQLQQSQQQVQDLLQFLDTKTAKEEGSLLNYPAPLKLFTWEVEQNRYVKFTPTAPLAQILDLATNLPTDLASDLTIIQNLTKQTGLTANQIVLISEIDRNFKKATAIINSLINSLKPWRKGPYKYLGQEVDAEWRSDLKWLRICDHLDLKDKYVLDVGSGNGYHTWCMKQQQYQAKAVFAIEPFENFSLQHLMSVILAKFTYAQNLTATESTAEQVANSTDSSMTSATPAQQFNHALAQLTANPYHTDLIAPFMIPLPLQQVPALAKFDVVFNMGVLYHRKDPIAFLEELKGFLFDRPDSTLVLETLVIDGDINTCLTPTDKYAGMDNVYHIPSIPLLERWLNMAGFKNTKVIDLTVTTVEEQRATPLSSPISLVDFLDPTDPSLTVESYPAPKRVTILASRN